MAAIAQLEPGQVVGGVDTHKHTHVAAVLNHVGRVLDVESFPVTPPATTGNSRPG